MTERKIQDGARNYSIDQLTDQFVSAILAEQFLSKEKLKPIIQSWIKVFVDLKKVPKDYNNIPKKNVHAQRLRTIEQKDAQIKFWLTIVREIDPDNMSKHYKQQEAMLVAKGFKEVK